MLQYFYKSGTQRAHVMNNEKHLLKKVFYACTVVEMAMTVEAVPAGVKRIVRKKW